MRKGHIAWNKGILYSEEMKRKLSVAHKGLDNHQKGRHHSEEARRKQSEAHKGKIPWNKGKEAVYSLETKHKMSEAKKGKPSGMAGKKFPQLSGKNHHNWQGGEIRIKCLICDKERYFGKSLIRKGGGKFCSRKCWGKWCSRNRVGNKVWNWRGGITPINAKIRGKIEYRLWRESVFARDNWTCQKCGQRGGYLEAHHIKPFAKFPDLRFAIDNGIALCKKCHKKAKGEI